MKTDKKITVSLTERNYQKVSDFAKENGVSFKLALNSFIEKGFIKKSNDYAELINFFKENFSDKNFNDFKKIETEFTKIETALKRIYEKVSTGKPGQPVSPEVKKLTAADMAK